MSIGVQAYKFYGSIYILGAFVATGLASLFLFVPRGQFFRRYQGKAVVLIPALALFVSFSSAAATGELKPLLNVAILGATFFIVASRMSSVSLGELLTGYALFAVFEVILVLATRAEWNPNALCNHIMFAALCSAAAFSAFQTLPARKLFAIGSVCFASLVGVSYSSRTATLAFLIVLATYVFVRNSRFNYRNLRFVGILCLLMTTYFSGDILGGLTDIAIDNLDNNNPIARFFLADKSVRNLEEGLFDRKVQWEAAFNTMLANPVLGIGYSKELPIVAAQEFRAHSAYLEIGYQCGVFALALWVLVYYSMLEYAASLIRKEPSHPLVFLLFASTSYLMLAGVMESSGMVSAGTAGNWIAVACFAHLKTHNRSPGVAQNRTSRRNAARSNQNGASVHGAAQKR